MHNTLNNILEDLKALDLSNVSAADLVPLVKAVQNIGAFAVTVDAEIKRRVAEGQSLPGVAVKPGITHRKWNDETLAADLAFAELGLKAFKLQSPAQIEKLGEAGAALVSVASFKPEADDRVVY